MLKVFLCLQMKKLLFHVTKDENINNHGYIDASILRIYQRYIDGYFGKKIR